MFNLFKKKRTYRKKPKVYRSVRDEINDGLKTALTNNVKANVVFSPLYFLMVAWVLNHWHFSSKPLWIYSFISTLVYVYASHFFQPDLDIHERRPGMGHFPLGKTIGYFKIGRFLKFLVYPINRAWYWLWHPYGNLLTHRGIGHYPILGVWIRILYLWAIYIVVKAIFLSYNFFPLLAAHLVLILLNMHKDPETFVEESMILRTQPRWLRKTLKFLGVIYLIYWLRKTSSVYWTAVKKIIQACAFWGLWIGVAFFIEKAGLANEFHNLTLGFEVWLRNFFPWLKKSNFLVFFLFCFPIYLSDLVHWAVDYYDSYRGGKSFCPPKIPRGLIVEFFNIITGRNL